MKRTVGEARDFTTNLGKEIGAFMVRLTRESERSAVVLGTARLEHGFEKALKAVMGHHPGGQDNLFDPDRPLGTLSAKIALAHRLGLIDDGYEHAVQVLRKIRNEFAHSIEDETLSLQRHRDRLRVVSVYARRGAIWKELEPVFSDLALSSVLQELAMSLSVLIVAIEMVAWAGERATVELSTAFVIAKE